MIELTKKEKESIKFIKYFISNSNSKKLCLFSHYDKDNRIDKYVIYMIKELYKLKFEIIFVTTSELMRNSELQKIAKYIKLAIVKKNIGYDFISWKVALSYIPNYKQYKTILNINDSIFFPLFNPKKMFDKMNRKKIDFWGINNRKYKKNFIHSFFWVFNKKIIKSKFFMNFWNDCEILNDKVSIVFKYEIPFTSKVENHGFSTGVYIDIEDVRKKVRKDNFPLYSTSYQIFWDILIKDFKAPYIKKNILISSHADFNIGTICWKYIINKYTKYNSHLIDNYINKMHTSISYKLETKQFYYDFNLLLKEINSLKNESNLNLYGYGDIGILINSILDTKINKIFDINYKQINNINKLHNIHYVTHNPNKLSPNKKILVSPLNRTKQISSYIINKLEIPSENIISLNNNLKYNKSTLTMNIARLSTILAYIHTANLKNILSISIMETSNNLAEICNQFMAFQNLNPMKIEKDKYNNINYQIIFIVTLLQTNKKRLIPFITI